MLKIKQTNLVLVIVITTTAIIAAAATTSLSAATPAFARLNCNEDLSICTGGTSHDDIPGGQGVRIVNEESFSSSGGLGQNAGAGGLVGGQGSHTVCDASGCSDPVGGSGLHPKGPGGNSGNAPPP